MNLGHMPKALTTSYEGNKKTKLHKSQEDVKCRVDSSSHLHSCFHAQ